MLIFPQQKTAIVEMPKTGTTWLRKVLTGWEEGTPKGNACERQGHWGNYEIPDGYLRVAVFREPVSWCISAWEYHTSRLRDNQLPVSRINQEHHPYFEAFPARVWSHSDWWRYTAGRPGLLTEFFRQYLSEADLVIPLPVLREDTLMLYDTGNVAAESRDIIRNTLAANTGPRQWRKPVDKQILASIAQVREQEAELFEAYRRLTDD